MAEVVVVNIDRVLDGVAVGRSLAKQDDVGIAYNRAVLDSDTMRKAAALQVPAPLAQIVLLRCVAVVVWLDPCCPARNCDPTSRLPHEVFE